jgi:MGT family glycosyltransferase
VNHSWGIFGSEVFHLAAEASAPLWQTRHLQVPPLAGLFAHLYLDICPPSLQAPNFISNGRALALRPVPFDDPPREVAPPWINGLGEMPTVYLTLGTVFNDAIKVFATVLDALGGTQVNLVVTVGRDGDPARFGAQPGNVRVERYVAQSLLLPHCDLVVTHGGSGTILAALAHGLPLLILPQGADNFRNARACEANGAARVLLPAAVNVEAVREEVGILLKDSRHRECAQRLHREIELMPGPEEVARQLEVFLDEAG